MALTVIAVREASKSTTSDKKPARSWADIAAGRTEASNEEIVNISQAEVAEALTKPDSEIVGDFAESTADTQSETTFCKEVAEVSTEETPAEFVRHVEFDSEQTCTAIEAAHNPPHGPLRSAKRGSFQCFCRGEVVMMKGSYGWLAAYGDIEHQDAEKHEGHVYVHKRDVMADRELVAGDLVSFYLYVDKQGLGAEYCSLEETCEYTSFGEDIFTEDCTYLQQPGEMHGSMRKQNLDHTAFYWSDGEASNVATSSFSLNPHAAEFQIDAHLTLSDVFSRPMNANATVFMPSALQDGGSEADNEDGSDLDDDSSMALSDDSASVSFSDVEKDDFNSSECDDEENDIAVWDEELEVVVMTAPFCAKESADDSAASTYEGESSDSDCYEALSKFPSCWVRPPPGLSLLS